MLSTLCALLLMVEPSVSRELAQNILFLEQPLAAPCDQGEPEGQIRCLITARYLKDRVASQTALELYAQTGTVVGVLPEQDFDGAYRGQLHLVPRLPIAEHRRHLIAISAALTDFDAFFAQLSGTPSFRWRALEVRVFESVKRKTPSAFAVGWLVAYNVSGSLFGSDAGVRGTLFHEVFHLNDQAHRQWSSRVLSPIYDRIVAKCGTKVACLEPYTPDSIKVRGGTYYDFQPGNGVHEYGADLGKRYYLEHRALQRKEPALKPFKCMNPENAKAWRLLVDEFFGGVDLTADCPTPSRPPP